MIGAMQDFTKVRNSIKATKEPNLPLREISWNPSHVVRAPLARLMGLVSLLQDDSEEIGRQEIEGYMAKLANELDSVIRIIVMQTAQAEHKDS